MTETVSYLVQPGSRGWSVVRYAELEGRRTVVATCHSEYAAQVRAREIARRARQRDERQ